ncbi:MAG: DUF3833 family protein [Sphingomicrobium sp.]
MIRPIVLAAAVLASAPAHAEALDPLAFFTDKTRGEGTLKIVFQSRVPVRIESFGRPDGRGGMTLDQTIHEGAKPPRDRRWVLRPTSPTTMVGTITDTPGQVHGRLSGNKLYLNYTMKGGLKASQVLTLQKGGRAIVNKMTVRRLGLVVARVEETIRKLD